MPNPLPQITSSSGQSLTLRSEAIGSGGEGKVYQISSPSSWQNKVVKLYYPQERNPIRLEKLRYLIQAPPSRPELFAWPEDIIFVNGAFAGFSMPFIDESEGLNTLCSLRMNAHLPAHWQDRYERNRVHHLEHRARICQGLAEVFAYIEDLNKYTWVDLKPANIRIRYSGSICLLDIDSIQVSEESQLLFPAKKISGEYAPAELKQLNYQEDWIPTSWDHFSLAVIFYRLMLGIHPFASSPKAPFSHLTSHAQKIALGLFPFSSQRKHLAVIPEPHQNFKALSPEVQKLFIQAFEQGHENPEKRPKPKEWAQAWLNFEIQKNAYHNPIPSPNTSIQPKKAPLVSKKPGNSLLQNIALVASLGLVSLLVLLGNSPRFDLFSSFSSSKEVVPPKSIVKQAQDLSLKIYRDHRGNYGLEGPLGEVLLKANYAFIRPFKEGKAAFQKEDTWGFMDTEGKEVVEARYQSVGDFQEGRAIIKEKGKFGFINSEGEEIIPARYDLVQGFKQGRAQVMEQGEEFWIDLEGKKISEN